MRPAPIVFFTLVATVVLSTLLPMFNRWEKLKPPPVYGALPAFSLLDTDSQQVNEKLFEDNIRIYSFFFTSCPEICPRLTGRIQSLAASHPDLKFVSISVDPQNDTPERLLEFAGKFKVASNRWRFLTGDPAVISNIQTSFKIAVEGGPSAHSARLFIVDRHGLIRSSYNALDEESVAALETDIEALRIL